MNMSPREAAINSSAKQIETQATLAARFRFQDVFVATLFAFAVLLSSALGTALFLR